MDLDQPHAAFAQRLMQSFGGKAAETTSLNESKSIPAFGQHGSSSGGRQKSVKFSNSVHVCVIGNSKDECAPQPSAHLTIPCSSGSGGSSRRSKVPESTYDSNVYAPYAYVYDNNTDNRDEYDDSAASDGGSTPTEFEFSDSDYNFAIVGGKHQVPQSPIM